MEAKGVVIRGKGMAAKAFGVPTANLKLPEGVVPEAGVFAGWAFFENEKRPCVVCAGAGEATKFEVHVLDYNGNLYEKQMTVLAFAKVSDLVPFEGEQQMKEKILVDVAKARTYFTRGD